MATSSQFVATSRTRLIGRRVPCFSRINCRRRIVQSRHAHRILLLWTLSECSQSNALARFAGGALPPLAISCPSIFLLLSSKLLALSLLFDLVCLCQSSGAGLKLLQICSAQTLTQHIKCIGTHSAESSAQRSRQREEGELLKNRRTQNSVCSSGLKWGSIFGSVCASDFSPLSFIEKLAVLRKCVG